MHKMTFLQIEHIINISVFYTIDWSVQSSNNFKWSDKPKYIEYVQPVIFCETRLCEYNSTKLLIEGHLVTSQVRKNRKSSIKLYIFWTDSPNAKCDFQMH